MAACSEEICVDSPPLLLKMGLCQKPLSSRFYVVGMHTTHARCWIQDRALGLAWCVCGQVAEHSGAPWAIWQASQASKMKQKEVSDTSMDEGGKHQQSNILYLLGLSSHSLKQNVAPTSELTDLVGNYGEWCWHHTHSKLWQACWWKEQRVVADQTHCWNCCSTLQ